jgi:uncharacterized protein (UPF0276 family)
MFDKNIGDANPTPSSMVGLGLRVPYISHVLENHKKIAKKIGFFEVHSENYYGDFSPSISSLTKIRKNFPISLHSVGNSLGSSDGIDLNHLKQLKNLVEIIEPFLISDHISWGYLNKKHLNDLLPLPYNEESLEVICKNISLMQNYLKREILVENPSAYLAFDNCKLSEMEFINKIVKKTGCKLLLDVNNIYVSAHNNKGFDAKKYLEELDKNIVGEIHLAGHSISKIFDGKKYKNIFIDTHNDVIKKEVLELYKIAIKKFGKISTLIEWDQDFPEFEVLLGEASKVKKILRN